MAKFEHGFFGDMPVAHFDGKDWQATQWQASNQLTLDPAAHGLHYGSTCFEGMKAYRQTNGDLVVYRIADHIARMQHSARGLCMPVPDSTQMHAMIIDLVSRASRLVPNAPSALYLRPTLIGTTPFLGRANSPSPNAIFYILAAPMTDYFDPSREMVLVIETKDWRCAPHMGNLKTGGNYSSALSLTQRAQAEHPNAQVLFCPNGDVQESGSANFIIIDGNTVITKKESSAFLSGITRRSVLQLAKDAGMTVQEINFTIDDLRSYLANGAEAMLTGTAAKIIPVSTLILDGKPYHITSHEKAFQLRETLTAIKHGEMADKHGWITKVTE